MNSIAKKYARPVACLAILAIALGIYVAGVAESPLLSSDIAERNHYIAEHSELDRAKRRARAYWADNPDVRENVFFGENGIQGVFGPRVHYDRHGKDEGRVWYR
jgi:hypothetical protein